MPRIRLAHWYDGHPPGTELDVSDDEARHLQRDGRVAAIVDSATAESTGGTDVAEPDSDDTQDAAAAAEEAEQPPTTSRRKRT